MSRSLSLLMLLLPFPLAASVPPVLPAEIQAALPGLSARGSGTFSVFWMDIYTASLWTGADGASVVLALRYLRELDGAAIAERSREEIESLGLADEHQLRAWEARMKTIFPDVSPGDQLTGVRFADGRTAFYLDETLLDIVEDEQFGHAFFAIWLHEDTSAPELRRELLLESEYSD